jgi:hypothetical protein
LSKKSQKIQIFPKKLQKVHPFYKKMTKNHKKYTFFLRFLQPNLPKRATFEPSTLSEVEGQIGPKSTHLRQIEIPGSDTFRPNTPCFWMRILVTNLPKCGKSKLPHPMLLEPGFTDSRNPEYH